MTRPALLLITWLFATIAIIVTQYSSIVHHMPPCEMCWYQRICYYPLFFILGIGAFIDDRRAAIYSLPLMLCAIGFSLYQYLLQMVPGMQAPAACTLQQNGAVSCSTIYFQYWGFITYPFISFIGSIVMSILLIWAIAKKDKHRDIFK